MHTTQNANIIQCINFPEHALGGLSPCIMSYSKSPCANEGAVVINGVELSQNVIEELRKLGIALSWYSASELQDAVIACNYDNNLVDDVEGVSFQDKLHLTWEEKTLHDSFWKTRVLKPLKLNEFLDGNEGEDEAQRVLH